MGEDARSTVRVLPTRADPRAQVDAAFDAWARTSGPALLRFAGALSASSPDAADAVQDALVAVYLRWDRLTRTGTPDAYARRVIANRRISWWRAIGRRESPMAYADVPVSSPAPSEDARLARELLRSLPARQRAAVVLRYYDDLTSKQIGALLGLAPAAVDMRLMRARRQLREHLAEPAVAADPPPAT